ncbi:MAG TPA: hypothetical protein VNY52_12070 [Solirubrobacteraceae bacterium]|jgi:hypothetical protein|nr:hypothetical protein [Solirubrobacteraceae bacterium]
MTTVLLVLETALLAVVAVFVVALLRSHAEILRRLAALEPRDPEAEGQSGAPVASPDGGERARDIAGRTLAGDAVKVRLGAGSPTTLLAFLSSGCAACGPLWDALHEHARVPAGARLVVVAKGPERESTARLHELAPAGREVLLSTEAWRDYAVPGSPHFVLVDGRTGWVAGRGSAGSWEQIVAMVEQAVADAAHAAAGAPYSGSAGGLSADSGADADPARSGLGGSRAPAPGTPERARTTSERAARAEQALAVAGIGAGHPSLYPADHHPAADLADRHPAGDQTDPGGRW